MIKISLDYTWTTGDLITATRLLAWNSQSLNIEKSANANIVTISKTGTGTGVALIISNAGTDAAIEVDGNDIVDSTGKIVSANFDTAHLPLAGGTMTGAILVNTADTHNLGSATVNWNNAYINILRGRQGNPSLRIIGATELQTARDIDIYTLGASLNEVLRFHIGSNAAQGSAGITCYENLTMSGEVEIRAHQIVRFDSTHTANCNVDFYQYKKMGAVDGVTLGIYTPNGGENDFIERLRIKGAAPVGGAGIVCYEPFTLNTLTASRALYTDANKVVASSAVTDTELGYVSGVTSAIQTQLNGVPQKVNLTTNETTASTSFINFTNWAGFTLDNGQSAHVQANIDAINSADYAYFNFGISAGTLGTNVFTTVSYALSTGTTFTTETDTFSNITVSTTARRTCFYHLHIYNNSGAQITVSPQKKAEGSGGGTSTFYGVRCSYVVTKS